MYKFVPSVCSYCGTGCGVLFKVLDGKLTGTLPLKTHPVNEGKLCIKGWNLHEFVNSPLRLKAPLVRINGRFAKVTWDRAIEYTAQKFQEVIAAHGPDSVGVLASAKITNEDNYLIQKFARAVIGTNNVDHCARLWHSSTVVGLTAAFGSGAMTNSIAEFADSGCIFVIGSNTTACHPLIARRIFQAKEKGAKLIVADPRNIQLGRFADLAVTHRLGSDVALLNGMMHLIIKNGWQAREYIEARTEGYEAFQASLDQYTPEKVQQITGVSPAAVEKLAELYANYAPAAILYTMGITQHTTGVDNVKAICNLAMLCGNIGVPGGGVNPLRGQNNVQGACDMGGLPHVFPGYQLVSNPDLNAKFAQAWDKPQLPDRPGLTILEMVNAILDGRLRALFVIGENPKLSDPDWQHLHHALKEIDFLVVQDLFLSETAQVADVVLAAASTAEKDGTFSNTERRCMRVFKAIDPIGDTLPDWEIICRLSTAMGYPMSYQHPEEIFREIASLTPSYAGMTYERLGLDGLQWPCPNPEHPGTPYLHKDNFTRGKGQFHALDYKDPAELPDEAYPYFLTTGRMFAHYHTGTMTRISPALDREQPTGYVEINPLDADQLQIHEGEVLVVTSPRGRVEAPAKITGAVKPGNLFMPIHFGENPTNVLTNAEAFDPLAKIPEFKVGKARLEKLEA